MLSSVQQSGFMQCLLRQFIDGADWLQAKYFLLPVRISICSKYVTEIIPGFRTIIFWISRDQIEKYSAFTISQLVFLNICNVLKLETQPVLTIVEVHFSKPLATEEHYILLPAILSKGSWDSGGSCALCAVVWYCSWLLDFGRGAVIVLSIKSHRQQA